MPQLWHLVILFAVLALSQSLDSGVFLQLDSCALQNVVSDILNNKESLDRMAKSPAAKKAIGKKGSSPVKGISQIKVEDLKFTDISVALLPGSGIHISVTNKIELSGKSFLGGKTVMKIEVNIVTITSLKMNDSNCPKFVRDECQTNLIDVKANLPKGVLPSVMNNFLDKSLKTLLPQTLCPAVDLILSEVNEKLCLKNTSFPFGTSGSLKYSIFQLPTVSEEHMEIAINITVHHGESIIHQSLNDTDSYEFPSNPGVTCLLLTPGFLGSIFTTLQEEGAFNLTANANELTDAGVMSPSDLSDILPEMPPDLQEYKIIIVVDESALVTLDPSKALLHLYVTLDLTASSPDFEDQSLFVVNLHITFRIQFSVDEKSLHCELSFDGTFSSLNSSSVGSFEVEDLDDFINSVIQEVYATAVNDVLLTAIPLPDIIQKLKIDFSKAEIETVKDLLVISVNVCKQ
ncbi:BPI fold-containing family B member 6 [Rhinophrynus dorsalis]